VQTFQILIHGKVQGVWYRKSARKIALDLGLKGTVQNLKDGGVEIFATGQQEKLVKLIEWCKMGPEMAEVSEVIFKEVGLTSYSDFGVIV
jgi:acylphosphatase